LQRLTCAADAGEHSYRVFEVSMRLHQLTRASLVARFQGDDVPAKSLLLFKGGEETCRHETGECDFNSALVRCSHS
jgi:hypothetical protein